MCAHLKVKHFLQVMPNYLSINPCLPAVLLRNIEQQVVQRHRARPGSDHGKRAVFTVCSHCTGYAEQIKQASLPHRGCTLCRACCWCAWACHWSIAPSLPTSWESCSSTSTTAGLTSSSWSAPSPASSSCTWLTSKRQRSTWPSDVLRHDADPLEGLSHWTRMTNWRPSRSPVTYYGM